MVVTPKQPQHDNTSRRIWHTPTSSAALYWCLFASIYCVVFYVLYFVLLKAPIFTGPWFDRVFRCGIMSFIMILVVAAYSLRTRLMRSLPWKAQSWVWMHTWLGIAALLLALLHADFRFILHGYCSMLPCVTDHYWAMPALYSLIFIVISGAIGRLIDKVQARTIAREASTNGIGIAKAIKVRLFELECLIERYCAGKSEAFNQYCVLALGSVGRLPKDVPALIPDEHVHFQRVYTILEDHARLARSLKKQNRAHFIFRTWRRVHMALVPLALLIISYHAIMELLTEVFHLIK